MRAHSDTSFSARVKAELCGRSLFDCCRFSALYGMLLFGRKYALSGIEMTTENEGVAHLAAELLNECFAIKLRPFRLGKKKLSVNIDAAQARKILERYGSVRPSGRQINYAALDSVQEKNKTVYPHELFHAQEDIQEELSCCYRAFLAGVFLVCGSISEPKRQYHLEFAIPFQRLADSLVRFFDELNFEPKLTKRGEHGNIRVLYFKDNERIADLLGLMGAVECSLSLAEIAIEKTFRNKANRQTNSDTANLNRAAAAAVRQLAAVRILEQRGQLKKLSPALREAAELRMENPEASLTELCALAGGVTRSSLYVRLKKLEQLSLNGDV